MIGLIILFIISILMIVIIAIGVNNDKQNDNQTYRCKNGNHVESVKYGFFAPPTVKEFDRYMKKTYCIFCNKTLKIE